MATDLLTHALDKLDPSDSVSIQAPEWADQDRRTLAARLVLAILFLVLVMLVIANAGHKLPSESYRDTTLQALNDRATAATTAVAGAHAARLEKVADLSDARSALIRARKDRTSSPDAIGLLRRERDVAKRELREASRTRDQLVGEQTAALAAVQATTPPSSDIDLVRAIGVGALALLALIAAGALVAPRRSQLLSVRRVFSPSVTGATTGGPPGGTEEDAESMGVSAADDVSRPTAGRGGVGQTEPALTQGVVAAVTLAAGLFGIQELEGPAEIVLNLALPLVPILGALFTRARVAPKPNLTPQERRRLFS